MIDALFHAFGTLFASAAGVLLLAVVAGAIFIIWDWRLALAGAVLIHLGSSSVLVHIHNVPGIVAGGQMLAVLLCAAMLALAGFLQTSAVSLRQGANWPLRSLALLFIVGAWWFLDPGYTLPFFSQPETELLIWSALCALAFWSFSGSPLLGGVGVLLWSALVYAVAAVLLPGSGLAAVVGIADLLLALACSYLVLVEPAAQMGGGRSLPRFAPHLRRQVSRPWGLVRRPTANGEAQPQLAPPVSAAVSAAVSAPEGREETATL